VGSRCNKTIGEHCVNVDRFAEVTADIFAKALDAKRGALLTGR
jgi:hypothetical protein